MFHPEYIDPKKLITNEDILKLFGQFTMLHTDEGFTYVKKFFLFADGQFTCTH